MVFTYCNGNIYEDFSSFFFFFFGGVGGESVLKLRKDSPHPLLKILDLGNLPPSKFVTHLWHAVLFSYQFMSDITYKWGQRHISQPQHILYTRCSFTTGLWKWHYFLTSSTASFGRPACLFPGNSPQEVIVDMLCLCCLACFCLDFLVKAALP